MSSFDNQVVSIGQEIGLDYLRVFPFVEGIYELSDNSSLRGIFRYRFTGLEFTGATEQLGSEGRIEYQLRF